MMNFSQGYSAEIQELFKALRDMIREAMPGAKEDVDTMVNMLAFQLKPGFLGTVFTLIPTEDHITVGFYGGAKLPDPHGLLGGKGAVHRHVKIHSLEQLQSAEFKELIRSAVEAAKERLNLASNDAG